jgi:phosphatidylinositol glycan class C protein
LNQTLPVTQHLASIFIFLSLFQSLYLSTLPAPYLLTLIIISWALGALLLGEGGTRTRGMVVPLGILWVLSPALKTLTRDTADDSIWALSGALLAGYLLGGDYRSSSSYGGTTSTGDLKDGTSRKGVGQQPGGSKSLPLALSATTLLSSRLSSNLSVFTLLLFSTLWFGPFSLWRSSLSPTPRWGVTSILVVGALVGMRGGEGAVVGMVLLAGTAVGVPLLRGMLGSWYKDRVRGPWDSAFVR